MLFGWVSSYGYLGPPNSPFAFPQRIMMNRILLMLVTFIFAASSGVSLAGISPTQGASAMSQSGAKIAAPKKSEEQPKIEEQQPKKDEKS
jgi:hypothetical protein